MSIKDRLKSFFSLVDRAEKQFGRGAIMSFAEHLEGEEVSVIPSGSIGLDWALGVGGWPRGRIVELFGPESSGKSTLALTAVRECQRLGKLAAYIDTEHALDPRYGRALGVDLENLLLSQPDDGEQALALVEFLLREADNIGLIVIDSVAALIPRSELEGDIEAQQIGLQARMMSKALRKIVGLAARRECSVIFINQLRQKIGFGFGGGEITTGGSALKYFSSVRVDLRRLGAIKSESGVIGHRVRAKVVKNKLSPPFKEAEFEIRFGEGISELAELVDWGVERGVVEKSGSWFSFEGEQLGQGRENVIKKLAGEPALTQKLRTIVRSEMGFSKGGTDSREVSGSASEKVSEKRKNKKKKRAA